MDWIRPMTAPLHRGGLSPRDRGVVQGVRQQRPQPSAPWNDEVIVARDRSLIQKVTGTWSAPARACWGRPPQLSTEKRLRINRRAQTSLTTKCGKWPCCRSFVEVLRPLCETDQDSLVSSSTAMGNDEETSDIIGAGLGNVPRRGRVAVRRRT